MIVNGPRLLLGALIIAASVALAGCNSPTATPGTNSATGSPGSVQNAVIISGHAYSPATIAVPVGTKVTWTNHDTTVHTVTSDDGKTFNSGNVAGGATFSFTFTTAGTFAYHCNIHPSMTAQVIVAP